MRITNQLTLRNTIRHYQINAGGVNNTIEKFANKLKIAHSYEDAGVFNDGTRLDYEIALLDQVEESTLKASEFTKNSDHTLQEFITELTNFRTKIVYAANNGVHDQTSLDAIADELEGIRTHLINVANTSVNGQYLFSGTALDVKPVDANGKYQGNDQIMEVVIGANQTTAYNIDGKTLFLGRDNDYKKISTTNVSLMNDRERILDPDKDVIIKQSDYIYQMIGRNYRTNAAVLEKGKLEYDSDFNKHVVKNLPDTTFFMKGRNVTGETFSLKFSLSADSSISKILEGIGKALGNTENNKVVDVILNESGQVEVTDLRTGNLLNDFSIFGLTAVEGASTESPLSDTEIKALTDMDEINQAIKDGKVHLTEFIRSSDLLTTDGKSSTATAYDELRFTKKDNVVTGNIEQIVRDTNEYATSSTKLVEVIGTRLVDNDGNIIKDAYGNPVKPSLTTDAYGNPVDHNITINVVGKDGVNYEARIDMTGNGSDGYPVVRISELDNNGNVVSLKYEGNIYTGKYLPNPDPYGKRTVGVKVAADEITYQNLNDIITVVAAGKFAPIVSNGDINATTDPQLTNDYESFNRALQIAQNYVKVDLDDHGRMRITDTSSSVTKIEVAMYEDLDVDDYPANIGFDQRSNGSVLSFNTNGAIIIDEAGVSLFDDLADIIESIRHNVYRADANAGNSRTIGIQGGLKRIDHLLDHVDKNTATIGSYTNILENTKERAEILEVNIKAVKSDILDADLGELTLQFNERLMGYQAQMMATSKISQMSLLNYL